VPQLRFRGVLRVFGAEPPIVALGGIDLTIDEGSYLAIEGPSGSGKSTLLNQLALVDRPTEGSYEIDGRAVEGLAERHRARLRSDTFGFIFQKFHLMPRRTAVENVEVGLLYRGVPPRRVWPSGPMSPRASCPAASSNASRSRGPRWETPP
jgi:ABC-type lipoprotein export system ATPase subunit